MLTVQIDLQFFHQVGVQFCWNAIQRCELNGLSKELRISDLLLGA